MSRKKAVIVGIEILIALAHFFKGGSNYNGPYPQFVNSYLFDLLIPFGFYFLLCVDNFWFFRHWVVKGFTVWGMGLGVEIAQLLGISLFGQTFDPVDVVMYGIGTLLAVCLDTLIFPRLFQFWSIEAV